MPVSWWAAAGPGEVSRALFPGAGGVWPGASLGSEIPTKPMSCLSTAVPPPWESPAPGELDRPLEQKSCTTGHPLAYCRAGQRCNVTRSTGSWRHPLQPLSSHELITSPRLWHPAKAGCTGPSRVAQGLGRRKTLKDYKIFGTQEAKCSRASRSYPFPVRKLRPE